MQLKFTPKNPDFVKTIRENLNRQYFMAHNAMELTRIEPGYTEATLVIAQQHLQQHLFVHGGATATMADIVMGFAAFSLAGAEEGTVTADLRVSYLNPGVGEKLIAKGWVVKPGNMLSFCESEVWVEQAGGELVLIAKASATMATIRPVKKDPAV